MNNKHQNQSNSDPTHRSERVYFFLRHNNDIDHITPVIYKWLTLYSIPTTVILTSEKFRNDYRINLLKEFKQIQIICLPDLFTSLSLPSLFIKYYFKHTSKIDAYIQKSASLRKHSKKILNKIAERIFEKNTKAIVIFDWTYTYFVRQIVNYAKIQQFPTISLPHGDAPYVNQMINTNDFDYHCLDGRANLDIFDYIVLPNQLCYSKYKRYIEKNKLKILGSPRYSDEWLDIISGHIAPINSIENKNNIKIVYFLRNNNFPVFWEEFIRSIKLILQFPNISLIVKHHPRNTTAKHLTKKLLNLYPELNNHMNKNLRFYYDAVNSSSLIKWADLIIDLGTSVTWEAVKQKKPILMPEYLYANYSTVAYYIKNTELRCRDELYDIVKSFHDNTTNEFYNENHRKKFIKEIIDVPDKNVLRRYCSFIKSCLDTTNKSSK